MMKNKKSKEVMKERQTKTKGVASREPNRH